MHYILTTNTPHDIDEVTGTLRAVLGKLDEKHPELARRGNFGGNADVGRIGDLSKSRTWFPPPPFPWLPSVTGSALAIDNVEEEDRPGCGQLHRLA